MFVHHEIAEDAAVSVDVDATAAALSPSAAALSPSAAVTSSVCFFSSFSFAEVFCGFLLAFKKGS